MIRFLAFLALFALLVAFLARFKERLGTRKFLASIAILGLLFASAFIYSALDNSKASATERLISAFASGKSLVCGDERISERTHNFNRATMVFMNKNKPIKTPIKGCQIAE